MQIVKLANCPKLNIDIQYTAQYIFFCKMKNSKSYTTAVAMAHILALTKK